MLQDEFPHQVIFQKLTKVPDGAGGHTSLWKNELILNGFMDTPSSRELFEAQQLNNPFDRNLYYPYRTDVTEDMRCQFKGDSYELVGRPQDQGSQEETMLVPLKLVKNGG